MNDLREALLDFHAAHTREQLKDVAAYRELCEAHDGEHEFEAIRALITEVNDALEGALRNAEGHVGEVMAGLVTVRKYVRRPAKLDICREIVRRRYAATWSAEQMDYFEAASVKLENWRDYFLSFTSFNPWAPGAINFVNLRHRELIGTGAGLLVERPDAVERNLLAQALDNWLSYINLRGFFWEKHQDPAEVVTDRLKNEAGGSFVFLQILQNTLFGRDPNEHPNYCLLEYEAANTDPSRVLVLLAEEFDDLIKAEELAYEEFEEWYNGLINRTLLELRPVEPEQAATDELQRIGTIIKTEVEKARQRLVTGAPA